MLKNLFKKFKNNKGLTGADIAAAVAVIALTMGVVTSIYINISNKSKSNLRYSAATRIATQIVENIQSLTYDEVVSVASETEVTDGNNLLNTTVPDGYTAKITYSSSATPAIIQDITVSVSYEVSGTTKNITLYTTKQKEFLEVSNEPDVTLLPNYGTKNYYPIKKVDDKYLVTSFSDPEWYNYDLSGSSKTYALVYETTGTEEIGAEISVDTSSSSVYAWIPRFGYDSNSNVYYCYGTSDYEIQYDYFTTSNNETVYGYLISRKKYKKNISYRIWFNWICNK